MLKGALYSLSCSNLKSSEVAVFNGQDMGSFKCTNGVLLEQSVENSQGRSGIGLANCFTLDWLHSIEEQKPTIIKGSTFACTITGNMISPNGSNYNSHGNKEKLSAWIEDKLKNESNSLENLAEIILNHFDGDFSLLILSKKGPEHIIAACKNASMIIGIDEDGIEVSSDSSTISDYITRYVDLDSHHMAIIRPEKDRSYFVSTEISSKSNKIFLN